MSRLPNPKVLQTVRESRGFEAHLAAEDAGISPTRLAQIESGEENPKKSELNRLAHTYAVPRQLLYARTPPELPQALIDFRTTDNRIAKLNGQTIRAIESTRQIQQYADYLLEIQPHLFTAASLPAVSTGSAIKEGAKVLRKTIGLERELPQRTDEALRLIRTNIENLGVFCLFMSFESGDHRGFCLFRDSNIPAIVVNTRNQTIESRLFTLLHEFMHLLVREEGISDPYNTSNRIERFCNRVTAEALAPHDLFVSFAKRVLMDRRKADLADIPEIAQRFHLSLQATALRLQETGLADQTLFERLKAAQGRRGNNETEERDVKIPPGIMKLARYGTGVGRFVKAAQDAGLASNLDLFRALRLKPKYVEKFLAASDHRIENFEADE